MTARKRFYTQAGITPGEDGICITLDGRPVRTPAGTRLAVPSRSLAEAIATEWQAQGDMIEPADMPLTQLASTALDRIGPQRDAILDQLAAYAGSELLCYRAEESGLAERQEAVWQPILDWADIRFGAPLCVTAGVMPITQAPESVAALRAAAAALDDWRLAAMQSITAATGSLILALAVAENRISAAEAFAAAHVDETWQIERWGDDAEAAQRREGLRRDITAAGHFLALCGA